MFFPSLRPRAVVPLPARMYGDRPNDRHPSALARFEGALLTGHDAERRRVRALALLDTMGRGHDGRRPDDRRATQVPPRHEARRIRHRFLKRPEPGGGERGLARGALLGSGAGRKCQCREENPPAGQRSRSVDGAHDG